MDSLQPLIDALTEGLASHNLVLAIGAGALIAAVVVLQLFGKLEKVPFLGPGVQVLLKVLRAVKLPAKAPPADPEKTGVAAVVPLKKADPP